MCQTAYSAAPVRPDFCDSIRATILWSTAVSQWFYSCHNIIGLRLHPTTLLLDLPIKPSARWLFTNPELGVSSKHCTFLRSGLSSEITSCAHVTDIFHDPQCVRGQENKSSVSSHDTINHIDWLTAARLQLQKEILVLSQITLHVHLLDVRGEHVLWQWHNSYRDRKHTTPWQRPADNVVFGCEKLRNYRKAGEIMMNRSTFNGSPGTND